MLVPAVRPEKEQVTGMILIMLERDQPRYRWIPRGADLNRAGIDSKKLENYMLIFEQSIFGRVQKPNVIVHAKKKTNHSSNADLNHKPYGLLIPVTTTVCGCVDVGATGDCGEWQCFTDTEWVDVDGGSGGPSGGGGSGGGGDGGSGGGSAAPDNPNHPEDPDCGGKGIRNSPIPSIKAPTEDDPYPNDPPMAQPCEGDEEEEPINEEISGTFVGEIIVDKTITRNDLTNCVYTKLNQSNIFKNLIAKFEGGSSTFDLKFELAETEKNDFGVLGGVLPNLVVKIDASWVTIRNDLEVASTFLHESMHAEMRRYLHTQEQNGSTIPGFPGSFTEDWNNYVKEKTGGVGAAEHKAMAENFIGYIANALAEFDNNQLDRKHYEAIAWDGLLGTKAWKNADQTKIGISRNVDAIDNRPNQCSR